MCKVLCVSRSGYYKWRSAEPSQQEKHKQELTKRILFHYEDNNGLYGSSKITQLLRREGLKVSEKTVGRIMREQGIRSRTVKKFKVNTTDSNHEFPIAPNLLNQNFKTSAPNKVWVVDIT
jgi:putative transposase